jgi:hypothetical protein
MNRRERNRLIQLWASRIVISALLFFLLTFAFWVLLFRSFAGYSPWPPMNTLRMKLLFFSVSGMAFSMFVLVLTTFSKISVDTELPMFVLLALSTLLSGIFLVSLLF